MMPAITYYFFESRRDKAGLTVAIEHYILALEGLLTTHQLMRLADVLDADEVDQSVLDQVEDWATVRLGAQSPWSSKASDILSQTACIPAHMKFRIERIVRLNSTTPVDRLTQSRFRTLNQCRAIFVAPSAPAVQRIAVLSQGMEALAQANQSLGLALSRLELEWLQQYFVTQGRDPSDAELVMFGQANSEHCRHKIFNADYQIDQQAAPNSLFQLIRTTHAQQPAQTVVAYADNAAILGQVASASEVASQVFHVLKAETHNHPTAVAPYPGAATGSGGEIRDEGAAGRGATPLAGLTAYSLSHLHLSVLPQAHEQHLGPCLLPHLASSKEILLQAPLGAAAFNNEFGRPNLGGALRVFEQKIDAIHFGFHKPIMLAAGWGLIHPTQAFKNKVQADDLLLQLGGPGYLIGFGGGAASSRTLENKNAELDFASVQRDNAEMQRRVQMVIDAATALGVDNPIQSIHDVGAGGLSNALPELVAADGLGAQIDLESIPLGSQGLSPMQIWSNESQERYVVALRPIDLPRLQALCQRERCPLAVLGVATATPRFLVVSRNASAPIVDWQMDALIGGLAPMQRQIKSYSPRVLPVSMAECNPTVKPLNSDDLRTLLLAVLAHPSVGSKRYLLTIGDRTVGGRTHRDSFVGPWQVPVADCVVTLDDWHSLNGAAAAIGERSPVAVFNAPAAGRLAVAESLLNLWSAPINSRDSVKLSCNWMANAANPDQDAALYATVAATSEFCRDLGVSIPVGKDSLSMQVSWQGQQVQSPVSLNVTAFASLPDINQTLTPQLQRNEASTLIWLRLSDRTRIAGSIMQQVLGLTQCSTVETPDVAASALSQLLQLLDDWRGRILAYHDVSDGGIWTSLCEMAFTARAGLNLQLAAFQQSSHAHASITNLQDCLLSEEAGVIVQMKDDDCPALLAEAFERGLCAQKIATPNWHEVPQIQLMAGQEPVTTFLLTELLATWDQVAFAICSERDDALCAQQEHQAIKALQPLLWADQTLDTDSLLSSSGPAIVTRVPRAAVLREQGVNSHQEMHAALACVGYEAIDVHMSDLQAGRYRLDDFQLLAACGGFSYGDVLGAGTGWAKSIRFNPQLAQQFADFFARDNSLVLGVCNGCQMLSQLSELMPQVPQLPRFVHNQSRRFEARLSMVKVLPTDSIFLQPLIGRELPIVVSHGEGRALGGQALAALRFIAPNGIKDDCYPYNPNGTVGGYTGFSALQGRLLLTMPHPERSIRNAHLSWRGSGALNADSAWLELFRAGYRFHAR